MQEIDLAPSTYNQKYVTILDAKKVKFKKHNGLKFTEISDLAYDKKSNTLYAISDRAILYTLRVKIKNKKIKKLKLLNAQSLKNRDGIKLSKKSADSEGLDMLDENLLISFERKPAIKLFGTNARCIKKYKLVKKLRNIKNYQSKNSALEAVTYSKKYGYITAPEKPLKRYIKHKLFSKKREWSFKKSGSITALQMLSKNKILVVEREFKALTFERVITLSLFNLKTSKLTQLLQMRTSEGWRVDNIEGVTKIDKNTFLLASDDNDSIFQETQFILIMLKYD